MAEVVQTGEVERKSNRGGKRPGAGRKPNYFKRLGIKTVTAAEILAHHDEPEMWAWFLRHKQPQIRLQALQYLTDRRDGKARQAVEVSGGVLHAHTVYRDPKLAALSPEELQALDALSRKLALPAPDGPQNQTQSKPALQAEIVGEEACLEGSRLETAENGSTRKAAAAQEDKDSGQARN